MNKRQIIASLANIANQLDNSGDFQNANQVTNILKKVAKFDDWDDGYDDDDDDGARCPDCGEWIGDYDYCIECDWNVEKDDDGPDFGDIEFSDFIDVDFGEEEMPTKYSPEKPGE